ncbi:MAG: hypothetical protein M1818_002957 [Claussenomyces sp. TS43310]|nr:MAG: hypothetical protein M1818_002957 [Claussenomyces sp. TS43310]
MILFFGVLCRPFSQYWAVPVWNEQCATYTTYSKIQMAFNISSDLGIILLPSTVLYQSGLPLRRKIILTCLFSLGIFTIICAILNKYYNFKSPLTTSYQLWYIREASVALWVGNLVGCWQLCQHFFHARSFDDTTSGFNNWIRSSARRPVDKSDDAAAPDSGESAWYETMFARIVGPNLPFSRASAPSSRDGLPLQELTSQPPEPPHSLHSDSTTEVR